MKFIGIRYPDPDGSTIQYLVDVQFIHNLVKSNGWSGVESLQFLL